MVNYITYSDLQGAEKIEVLTSLKSPSLPDLSSKNTDREKRINKIKSQINTIVKSCNIQNQCDIKYAELHDRNISVVEFECKKSKKQISTNFTKWEDFNDLVDKLKGFEVGCNLVMTEFKIISDIPKTTVIVEKPKPIPMAKPLRF